MQGMKGLDGDLKNGFGKFPRSRGRENWRQWYAFVRASAMAGSTWDYFNPDLEPNPEPVLSPKHGFHDIRLRLDKMKKNAGSEQELRCWTCIVDNDVDDDVNDDDPFVDDQKCNSCRDRLYRKLVMPEKVARDLYGRGSVTLKRQDDWPKWYAVMKQAAKWKGVWEHIDLDVEDDKLPARPHRVHPNLEPAINKLKELSAAERKRSEDDAEHFKAVEMVLLSDQKRRVDFDTGKGYIVWAILSTVAEPLVVYLYEETDPRKMLLILKERIPPALPEGYEQLQARENRRNRRNRRR